MLQSQLNNAAKPAEADLIRKAVAGDEMAVRAIIRAHNRRLYRVARSIVRDDSEAEDVLQEAYLHAFSALADFRGQSSLSTWLTRIVFNEALQRRRRRVDLPTEQTGLQQKMQSQVIPFPYVGNRAVDPESMTVQREVISLIEHAIDELPEDFRTVLVARAIEDMSIEETAELLGIKPETVKTRLHRARRLLKEDLADYFGSFMDDVFPFDGARCDRVTNAVIERLKKSTP
ncbi:MAG TPA: RNA polymerase sigma factor [Hyphomicrobium sp.]|jgi:RNA polymerase sigma-70 factor (ECF subfamily)|nr:RNA polymerase sigma factor [Hyphomicrobium sp.]